ncbi:MAG TPA: RimK family alpha-L-glutamate ligase [Xanthobacteraceae bacterium]|jgi:tetrahydromethanopterin:alpha-L-glutamate ligase|nr:RimK family alpha-L-glutamate ligase [Xanthobacteraceae bacterium]
MRLSLETIATKPAARRPHVGLVVDHMDWHARALSRALTALGATSAPIRLTACGFATLSATGIAIDGFGDGPPDAILVRSMSGGSFEAVTLRLGILHAARELGVMVWNDARAIERCVDKSMTSFLLARAGVATPPTWAVESRAAAAAIVVREAVDRPLVLKPLFGSQGRGLRLIRTPNDLPEPAVINGVYYLQRFVGVERDGFRDFRLLVSRGRIIAAMARHSSRWITNVKRGARPVAVVANEEMRELALRAAAAVGAAFAGVDVLYDVDGRPTVLEVNSMPAWSGLQKVTPFSIAAALAGDVIAAMAEHLVRGASA